jgi:epoxyqueuosine reductase
MTDVRKLSELDSDALLALMTPLREWAAALGFSQIGVADVDLSSAEPGLMAWLHNGFHGSMDYMAAHGLKRARPAELVPGTVRVVTARMDYLPRDTPDDWQAIEWARLQRPADAAVSVYARGRDYHKVLRNRLQKLAERLAEAVGPYGHRVFTDSAPVLEVELASRSGIGWRGKHTLTLHREAGSTFFLGEIYVDLPLPLSEPVSSHCGSCSACIDVCPTRAIVAPYRLDARRCISYLTIEHDGNIPEDLRAPMGNRIYGCDDCQLICPWNKYAQRNPLPDFDPRAPLGHATLLQLWAWSESEFLRHTEGSAIRRIGHARWQRNIAVALGNALRATHDPQIASALQAAREGASPMLREHIDWALAQA